MNTPDNAASSDDIFLQELLGQKEPNPESRQGKGLRVYTGRSDIPRVRGSEGLTWKEFGNEFIKIKRQNPVSSLPKFGKYLLWYLPRDSRKVIMGDLQEEYEEVHNEFGRMKALVWFYYQVCASFWPFAVTAVQKLTKWGVFAWLGEAMRRIIS